MGGVMARTGQRVPLPPNKLNSKLTFITTFLVDCMRAVHRGPGVPNHN